MFLKVLLVHLK